MIVVTNASLTQSASVELRLEGLEDAQRFRSIDGSLEVTPEDGALHLQLEPLEAHILVAGPAAYAVDSAPAHDDDDTFARTSR
jgi:hypothetical protein